MINYGDAPSNQMELVLPGINDVSHEVWEDIKKWVVLNYKEWSYYKDYADKNRGQDGKASPNECLMAVRIKFHTSIPNAWAPALARLAKQQSPQLDFRLAKSMFDACAQVKL